MTSWMRGEEAHIESDAEKTYVKLSITHSSISQPKLTEYSKDGVDGPKIPIMKRDAADFYRPQPVLDRRIHIMGVQNVGSFIAHALGGILNPPPITLIFARWEKLNAWNESKQRLTLITDDDVEVCDGFDAEIAIPRIRYHGQEVGLNTGESSENLSEGEHNSPAQTLPGESTDPISSLIICSKAPHVLQGLSAVKHRLHKDSVILFMQNGMGTIAEVNREIFPDPATRPRYMVGVNSHGIYSSLSDPFTTVHNGFGTISVGILPHERERDPNEPYLPSIAFKATTSIPIEPKFPAEINPEYPPPTSAHFRWTPNDRYLLRTLLRTPVLAAASYSPPDMLQRQLDQLAVNCIIHPLTVMLDARNGAILNNYALTRTLRLLLAEISLVIRSLPELQYIPNVDQRFDPGRLETIVVAVAYKTRDNISTMLAETREGRQSDIDYLNGWIVQRGEELGIKCFMNYMMVQLVKGKRQNNMRETSEGVPLVGRSKNNEGQLTIREQTARKKNTEGEVKINEVTAEMQDALSGY